MDKPSVYIGAGGVPARSLPLPSGALFDLLQSDVATDIEVVSRELGLSDVMLERRRRALDRLNCAQAVLEAET
jgi:hypothetical protein